MRRLIWRIKLVAALIYILFGVILAASGIIGFILIDRSIH